VDPALVGNTRQIVVSELSGRGNIRMLVSNLGMSTGIDPAIVLQQVKELENKGFHFENAEGTVELMIRRAAPDYEKPFELIDMMIVSSHLKGLNNIEAIVKIRVGDEVFHTAAEGNGPVNALDQALKKALIPSYPNMADVKLVDYKVRILDPNQATAAVTRVWIEATAPDSHWCTVGCSANIIEASYQALADSFELYLLRNLQQPHVLANH